MTYETTRRTEQLRPGDVVTLFTGEQVTVTTISGDGSGRLTVTWDGGSENTLWDARWTVTVPGSVFHDYDGHTRTTVTLTTDSAFIAVRMLPGWRSWSCPTAAALRRYVDTAIAESDNPNRHRIGYIRPRETSTGWFAMVGLITTT